MRTLDGYRKGIACFESALARDPDFALPYTGIADCWAMLGFDYFGGVPAAEGMPRARAAARRALDGEAIDPPPGDGLTPSDLLSEQLDVLVRDPVYEAAVAAVE